MVSRSLLCARTCFYRIWLAGEKAEEERRCQRLAELAFFRILYPAFALYSPFFSFLFTDEWAAAPDSAGYCRGNLFRRAWRRRWKKRSVPLLRHRPRHVKNSPFVGGRVLIIIPEHTEIAGVRSRPTVWLASSEFVASDARVSLRTRRQPLQSVLSKLPRKNTDARTKRKVG